MDQKKNDITKPFILPVGLYEINDNETYNFQLNRLINYDLADVELVKKVGKDITDDASWKRILLDTAKEQHQKGNIRNAMAFYRMAEFFMEYDDPDALKAWSTARELFFQYFEDFFSGDQPIVEKFDVPYENYTMPVLKLNPTESSSKGVIVMHGGFDSSYEEFFPAMMYLRQHGYTVYLFEGPGQGECIRLHNSSLPVEWEKPVMTLTKYFDLHDVTLIGASLGGFYAPRASAFDDRVERCVSWSQFPSLKQNFHNNSLMGRMIVFFINTSVISFGWLIDIIYKARKGKGMSFLKTYFHRTGTKNMYQLRRFLWKIDLRPIADKLTKDYLIIGGSKDIMNSRASIGKQMYLMKNARSITAREITEKEQGADHCNTGNQQIVMDTILLWMESLRRRDSTIKRYKEKIL
ncbi:hypothetical protein PIROE2DRAFT_10596 [Piromyces sp. E2]|nr:hypothetical protein PIROE2DRAFT_10596 [Piromyces sp. E2]|eukprot:OUM62968.1 hypothetical protein PIROE2DRAFT_10596 [Piromyces sp. E2]